MYKYFSTLICCFIIFNSCSTKQIPGYYKQESIDSTNIQASIQPFDYTWNTDGHLIDLMRAKYDKNLPFESPFNIILSFENMKPDTFSVYICLQHEDSCVKIAERFFNGGYYTIGFQKLDIESGFYGIKIVNDDVEYYEQRFIERLPDD